MQLIQDSLTLHRSLRFHYNTLEHSILYGTEVGAASEVWNRVYLIASVKKFGWVTLNTNFPSKQIWRRMQTRKDDEFLLGFKFSRVQTSRKGWGVMYEQFTADFTFRDSPASRQVQLFISSVNFTSDLPAPCLMCFHLQRYWDSLPYPKHMLRAHYTSMSLATVIRECSLNQFSTSLFVSLFVFIHHKRYFWA